MGDDLMQTRFSGFLMALLLSGLTACGESELEKQRQEYNQKIEEAAARIESLHFEVGGSQTQLVTLQAKLDSLDKFEMLLQEKNQQLRKEVKKYRSMAEKRRRMNVELQEAISLLQGEKEADAAQIDRLIVASDSLTAALREQRDLTWKLSEELEDANRKIERTEAELDQAKNTVRVVVGTEDRLKEEGFLETGRRFFRKGYKLVQKPGHDDYKVKILTIGEPLPLNPGQKLKELIGRSGKLKKGQDYMLGVSEGITHVIIVNEILRGEAVLVVVE
jgi:hypothetical protein